VKGLILLAVYSAAGLSAIVATVVAAVLAAVLRWWFGFSDGRWPWI
jgi:hypothetical protein